MLAYHFRTVLSLSHNLYSRCRQTALEINTDNRDNKNISSHNTSPLNCEVQSEHRNALLAYESLDLLEPVHLIMGLLICITENVPPAVAIWTSETCNLSQALDATCDCLSESSHIWSESFPSMLVLCLRKFVVYSG
jgi:hypothetical protein